MSNKLFKVRVINKSKPELARKWLNYNIATSAYAKAAGWVIEDPELNEKLKANGLEPIEKTELKPEPKTKEDVEEVVKEESTTDKVKEELKDDIEKIDYDKLTFPELRQAAKDKGINTFGKKKTVIIEELKDK